jgi:hypothetical protein
MLHLAKQAVKNVLVGDLDRRLRTSRATMLLVYGHMRSGSSLLVHILNTNPEIVGYGETHFRYEEPRDFAVNAFDILRSFSRWRLKERYILDKVLGKKLGPSPDLLLRRSTRTILLLRRPEETLPSVLGRGLANQDTPEKALAYYVERLEDIRRLASSVPHRQWTFVRYDELVDSAPRVLQRLTEFLELREPLRQDYDRMWSTGRRRIGDSSPAISTGRIVSVSRKYEHEVPDSILVQAREHFDSCLSALDDLSRTPDA